MKKVFYIVLAVFFGIIITVPALAATEGTATADATVSTIIDLEVTDADAIGNIQTALRSANVFDIVLSNNEEDGFTLTFQSGNGDHTSTIHTGDMYGYLIHESVADAGVARDGQIPSSRYTLKLVTEAVANLPAGDQFGTTTTPPEVNDDVAGGDCTSLSGSDDDDEMLIEDNNGAVLTFNDVYRASIDSHYNVCLAQQQDVDMFHGVLSDEITVTIADI